MQTKRRQSRVEGLKVRHNPPVTFLQVENFGCLVHHVTLAVNEAAKGALDLVFLLELRDDQRVHDLSGNVGVFVASSRPRSQVVLKAVAAVEKLANIAADVVIQHESSTGMPRNVAGHVKHELIENDELTTVLDQVIELLLGHRCVNFEEGVLSCQSASIETLCHRQASPKECKVEDS